MEELDLRFGLWYDFRNPAEWHRPNQQFYRELLDQMEWAETLGYKSVWLSEHHFFEDGYNPSPLVTAAAIAERTNLHISTNVMVLPLHNPIRVAEDAATLSILSGGRYDLGVALGYREPEFEAFERNLKFRPSYMEEGVEIIRRAWRGERINFEGKRFTVPDLKITPVPENPPKIFMGGKSAPAAHRAARIADGFLSTRNMHEDSYIEGLKIAGKDPSEGRIYAGQYVIIDEDPEKSWSIAGKHAVYQVNEYVSKGAIVTGDKATIVDGPSQLLSNGSFKLWDGPTAVKEIVEMVKNRPQIKDIHFWAQLPGEPIENGSKRIEFFAKNVMPKVYEELSKYSKLTTK